LSAVDASIQSALRLLRLVFVGLAGGRFELAVDPGRGLSLVGVGGGATSAASSRRALR
jgi:hypothetical protein